MNKNEFVISYAEYIYETAYKCYWKLKGRPTTEDETDHICDIAVKLIETFSTKVDEGGLNFRGESTMKTYLYGVVFNNMRENLYGKQYYPVYVNEHREVGRLIYNLRYISNYSRKETLELVTQETSMTMKEIDYIDRCISKKMKSSIVSKTKISNKNTIEQSQLDEFIGEIVFSDKQTPEDKLLVGEIRSKILSILDVLKPIHRDVIRLKFIEGSTLEQIQNEFDFKNSQAVYNCIHSAKGSFMKEAKKQNLGEWLDFTLKGLNDER